MNKKIIIQLSLAALLCGACTSADDLIPQDSTEQSTATAELLMKADGTPVSDLSGNFGEYYVDVNTDGAWKLESSNDIISPTQTEGVGRCRVPVYVYNNYGARRASTLTLTDNATSTTTSTTYTQLTIADLEAVKNVISANKGAGFTYIPNENVQMGVNMQIFNQRALNNMENTLGYNFLTDDLFPRTQQEVFISNSELELKNKLAISASVSLDFSALSISLSGSYKDAEESEQTYKYATERLKSTIWTRELQYLNIVAAAKKFPAFVDSLYAPGFKMYLDRFTAVFDSTKDQTARDAACKEFIECVGPCFISKATMGTSMDYTVSVQKTALSDTLDISGALDLNIKNTLRIKGEGEYTDAENSVLENSNINCDVRGGNISLVNILATGGKLDYGQVTLWQASCNPENASLVDIALQPIYSVIFHNESHDYLRDYMNKKIKEGRQ